MVALRVQPNRTDDVSGSIHSRGVTVVGAERPEIDHLPSKPDESVPAATSSLARTDDFAGVVDVRGVTRLAAERAEVAHRPV